MIAAELNRQFQEIRLAVKSSEVYFWLSLASAVDTLEQQERCRLLSLDVREGPDGGWRAEAVWQSSIWKEKKHCYVFRNGRLEHWIEVFGHGGISELTFLSGTVDDGERGSIPGFGEVYVPCPNFLDKPYSHPSEYTAISVGNVKELWGSALNAGPLMFAFGEREQKGWLAAGLQPRPGAYGFHTMAWNKKRPAALAERDHIVGPQAISLDYLGNEKVDGHWVSPKLIFFAAEDAAACVRQYCEDLRRSGLVPQPPAEKHAWWMRPIFCSWHEQVALAQIEMASRPRGMELMEGWGFCAGKCTQVNMERWLNTLQAHNIHPGTIIIDAGWQRDLASNEADTAKFPDLRGFIEDRHSQGQRVVLWIRARETRGLPPEWCVRRNGEPVLPDPTYPAYREYVENMMRRMLGNGPGSYNADGIKVDGTNQQPGGPGLKSHGGVYGFELLHAYLKLIYDAATAVKSDAMITLYTANPYFADCGNVVRLGDLYTFRGDPRHTLHWRAETIRAAMPHVPIDTDGSFRFSLRDDIAELIEHQIAVGIPCLYQAEYLVQHRAFAPVRIRKLSTSDYEAISRALAAYEAQFTAENPAPE